MASCYIAMWPARRICFSLRRPPRQISPFGTQSPVKGLLWWKTKQGFLRWGQMQGWPGWKREQGSIRWRR